MLGQLFYPCIHDAAKGMAMASNKTQTTVIEPHDFIETVEHPTRKADALILLDLFTRISGFQPKMWGPAIIGYGRYHYTYDSGREGDSLATGFSPRKTNLSIYVMPGYQDYSAIMARLGTGESRLELRA
jgi:hypothetical protein